MYITCIYLRILWIHLEWSTVVPWVVRASHFTHNILFLHVFCIILTWNVWKKNWGAFLPETTWRHFNIYYENLTHFFLCWKFDSLCKWGFLCHIDIQIWKQSSSRNYYDHKFYRCTLFIALLERKCYFKSWLTTACRQAVSAIS